MNKNAFMLIELLAVIILLGILGGLATGAYYKYLDSSRRKSFEMAEGTFVNDVKNAYTDCLSNSTNGFCQKYERPQRNNETETIYLSDLIEYGYSDKIENPYNNCDKFDDTSSVVVTLKRKKKVKDKKTGELYQDAEIPIAEQSYECDYDLTLATSKYYYCEYEYTVCFKCTASGVCEENK